MTRKIGIVFPGQGSQYEGMGQDLLENPVYKLAKEVLENEGLHETYEILRRANIEHLSKTRYAQLAIFLNSVGLFEEIKSRIPNLEIYAMSGLSLGEYSALCSSGVISLESAIKLVEYRGNIMAEGVRGQGTMLAIMKTECADVEDMVNHIRSKNAGIKNLDIANLNCPGQIVVGGEFEAIDLLEEECKSRGIKKTVRLNVEGPFHTKVLEKSAEMFSEELAKVNFDTDIFDKIKIFRNIDGMYYKPDDDPVDILKQQMHSRVMFEESIRNMISDGVDTVIEVGPGKSLTGFVKKIDKTVATINIQTIVDINTKLENII